MTKKHRHLEKVLILVMMLGATMLASGFSSAGPVGQRIFVNSRYGYAIHYPATAHLSPAKPNAPAVKLLLAAGSPPLLIDATPNPKALSPATWAAQLQMTHSFGDRNAPPALRQLDAMATNVGGHPAYTRRYQYGALTFREFFIANGYIMLQIRWPVSEDEWLPLPAGGTAGYETIFHTLRLFPPAPAERLGSPTPTTTPAGADIPPLSVPIFSQNGQPWSDEQLGTCTGLTIGSAGCAVTSKAMIADFFAIQVDIPAEHSTTGQARSGMDPGILNNWYVWQGGFAQDPRNGGACLIWASDRGEVPHLHFLRRLYNADPDGAIDPDKIALIDVALADRRPVMATVHTLAIPQHFVVIAGHHGGYYQINDPWYGLHTTFQNGNPYLSGGRYVIDYLWFFENRNQPHTLCTPPEPVFPSPLEIVPTFNLTFQWQAPNCAAIDSYRLRVTTSENIASPPWIISREILGPTTQVSVTIPAEYEYHTLFWSLEAHNPAGYGAAGGPWRFVIDLGATVTPFAPPTPTPTDTPLTTPTDTPSPTPTDTPSPTLTDTPSPTLTDTPSPTPTDTPSPTLTDTPSPTPTDTPSPTLTDTPSPTPAGTFIFLEAESGTLRGTFQVAAEKQASACRYVHTTNKGDNGIAAYSFSVSRPGEYILWARARGYDWQHHAFWLTIDTRKAVPLVITHWEQQWHWQSVQSGNEPVHWVLLAGPHTLYVRQGEAHAYLDRLILTDNTTFCPTEADITICREHPYHNYFPASSW